MKPDEVFDSDVGQIVGRFGDVVHRRASRWTPAVHQLLHHLESVGFNEAPRAIGIDGGVELLSFIPGVSGADAWAKVATDHGLSAFARLLRSYHNAVRDFSPTDAGWAFEADAADQEVLISHGDFGPWNTVWQDDELVGLLDWDYAAPRPAMHDVGYALQYIAPFRDDEECVRWLGFESPPDRRRRADVFAEAYGLSSVAGLFDAAVAAQERSIREVTALAAEGLEPQASWVSTGQLQVMKEGIDRTGSFRVEVEGRPPKR